MGFLDMIDGFDIIGGFDVVIIDFFFSGYSVFALAAGGQHTCAILNQSSVVCWGFNGYGQLGNGNTSYKLIPSAVDPSTGANLDNANK